LAFGFLQEGLGADCSIDDQFALRLPNQALIDGLGLRWTGIGADFVDASGRLIARDPTTDTNGPNALLLREDVVREYLAREKLTICWVILGEKRILPPGVGNGPNYPALRMSGAYILAKNRSVGFVKYMVDDPAHAEPESSPKILDIVRNGY